MLFINIKCDDEIFYDISSNSDILLGSSIYIHFFERSQIAIQVTPDLRFESLFQVFEPQKRYV